MLFKHKTSPMKYVSIIFLVVFSFFVSDIVAQSVINVSGGDAYGGNGSSSYSVGQLFYSEELGNGVQQPYQVTPVEFVDDDLKINVFPNPTSDILKISSNTFQNVSLNLYNSEGKLLICDNLIDFETEISLTQFNDSIYILELIYNGKKSKVFKVIKK